MSMEASETLDSAVTQGDVQAVEEALRSGVSPDAVWTDEDGYEYPLLYTAAMVRGVAESALSE